tara:strand:- start:389 stop:1870 length:1482 start_codon:yes stop_codon:yes gene_type:complete
MSITAGGSLNSVALPNKVATAQNYLDFTTAADGWAKQYLPEVMEKEAEVFGNRTIAGFLSQVGAEEAMMSDQVIWSEQGRLHLCFTGTINTATSVIHINNDIDGTGDPAANQPIRVNDQVLVAIDDSGVTNTLMCHVQYVDGDDITATPYGYENWDDHTSIATETGTGTTCTVLVVGSEYGKGTDGPASSNSPAHKTFTQKPIILKDKYTVNGSDTAQIGWVEVSGEDGTGGYLWYLKAEGETRMRFTDYLEMAMLESVLPDSTNSHVIDAGATSSTADSLGTNSGHEGLWAAITSRGNISTGIDGVNAATDLAEFDLILAEFDKQGAIEENMLFCNRNVSLAVDDMLASMNSYGSGGSSYGVFDNDEDMALNLGFSGFRRGSYDFYKSDMKYLNDRGTRGAINEKDPTNAIRGCFIPAGVSSVYDQMLGRNLKRPFLHVRYRASQTDNRRFKTWVTGSVGAATSDLDAMTINYLSERCLITQGANNFMLLKG